MSEPKPGERGRVMRDDDAHWYFILEEDQEAFEAWVAAEGDGPVDFNDRRIEHPSGYQFTLVGFP
jgi:hypothetical protein